MPTTSDVPEWNEFNKQHPERKEGYFFLGNYRKKDINLLQRKYTKMYTGNIAYSPSGKRINDLDGPYPLHVPVFVDEKEWSKDVELAMPLSYIL